MAQSLSELQARIDAIYRARDASRGAALNMLWLVEEVGELSRALRRRLLAQRAAARTSAAGSVGGDPVDTDYVGADASATGEVRRGLSKSGEAGDTAGSDAAEGDEGDVAGGDGSDVARGDCSDAAGGPSAADEANLREEFADVLAWLLTLASDSGVDLEAAFAARYGNGCPYCQATPCACP